jgi:hypothetical protein
LALLSKFSDLLIESQLRRHHRLFFPVRPHVHALAAALAASEVTSEGTMNSAFVEQKKR